MLLQMFDKERGQMFFITHQIPFPPSFLHINHQMLDQRKKTNKKTSIAPVCDIGQITVGDIKQTKLQVTLRNCKLWT